VENLSFWIWVAAILLIAGSGLGAMLFAYWGKGSVVVVFPDAIAADPPAPTLNPEAAAEFQQGCEAYRTGRYRQAVTRFTQALQFDPELAEAYHNRGRATANLRRVTDAVADLVKASELYLQQGNVTELAQLKQDLETLKQK
jgi:tetratricopeptide (TPR) repeat protein